jgi:deoxyribodipyrimidine photo-lyase
LVEVKTFFAHDERVEIYRPGTVAQGKCVLYWMQRAQRGSENAALNAAIALGNTLHLPIVVLFVIADYPAANLRHYTFMLEGLAVAAEALQKCGTPLILRRGEPVQEVVRMTRELQAVAVISDECELRTPHSWRMALKEILAIPFACVDADVVVPRKHFAKEEWAARTLRPKLQRLLPTYLQPIIDLEPICRLSHPPCATGQTDTPLSYLNTLQIDRSVQPSKQFHGGQIEGKQRVQRFMTERLAGYGEQRNHPEVHGTSELSAYLHFGQISIQHTAWEIEQYAPPTTGSAQIDIDGGRAAYLEELIVRRELASNFTTHNPRYDSLAGCPNWGIETLRKHANDPREWVYTRAELEQARTHDELWNASQREMLISGRMHGYMRMYWAKKILEWTATPEEAFEHTIYLNDKYELDGRDANGYTGIAWAIGGKHDRPWGPERPIFGLVRYMALSGMQRKLDTRAYIYKVGLLSS